MIPVKLTIEGLYSYQKRQTIEFDRLTSANIFGIFGQVGSGKSSILEAISYALYAETERLGGKDSRGYNMMNLRSDSLLIEFEFISGVNHQRYLVTVTARRNSKRFEDVRSFDRRCFIFQEGDWKPLQSEDLVAAIGLSYANFKRTIIIPQGKFQEFLQLEKKERTNMMKELFNLEKYDLHAKASALDRRNSEEKRHLDGQVAALNHVDESQLVALREQLVTLRKGIADGDARLEERRSVADRWRRLKVLFDSRKLLQEQQRELELKRTTITSLEQSLREYEYAVFHFKSLFDQEYKSQEAIDATQQAIQREQEQLSAYLNQVETKKRKLVEIDGDYEQREMLLHQAEEWHAIADIKRQELEIDSLNTRIGKGEAMLQEIRDRSVEQEKQLDSTREKIQKNKDIIPDVTRLSAAREWFSTKASLEEHLKSLRNEVDIQQRSKERIEQELQHLFLQPILSEHGTITSVEEGQKALNLVREQLIGKAKESEGLLAHLKVQKRLGEYASSLANGEPCPLCGSVHHPQILSIDDVEVSIAKEEHERESLDAKLAMLTDIDRQLSTLGATWKLTSDGNQRAIESVDKQLESLRLHDTLFVWSDLSTLEKVNEGFKQVQVLESAIKELEQEQQRLMVDLKDTAQKVEKYRSALDEFKKQIASLNGQKELLMGKLKNVRFEDYLTDSADDMQIKGERLTLKVKEVVALHEQLSRENADLMVAVGKAQGGVNTLNQALKAEKQSLAATTASIVERLQASGKSSIEEVRAVLAQSIDMEQVRKQVGDYHNAVQSLADQLKVNEQEMGGEAYSQESHGAVDAEVAQLSKTVADYRTEAGRLEKELDTKVEILERLKKITAQLEVINRRAEELSLLKNMLQGNRFIDFVSTTYLENLCAAANDRFHRMTRQRLSLELTEDNSFQVRDYMNGGRTRSVKTLSGGQTFQASLALALALSDNIHRMQSADQNFFFLDEGFGTLDKESLSVVFETLKSLRRENRIVGIISHVDEMQQEIETYIEVTNDEEQGSLIRFSWK